MPVLRDIVARLGMDYDGRGFKRADKSINGIKSGLGGIATAAATAAAAIGATMGALKLIGLASDVQETLNVLEQSFGDNTEAVKKWASDFANNVGRSEYTMRELAGTLGAVVNPMMGRNREVAAEMSTRLAELAVDLRSFYNLASDKAALDKLRAGITGESEPLKQLGVVMTEATLAQYALDTGVKKSVKNMSIAEKTMLRYNFILDQTKDAHGDALRTSEGWANATQALWGSLKDVGTTIGLYLLPGAQRLLNWTVGIVRGFQRLVKETKLVQAAMIVLGSVAAALAVKMLIAFAPLILKFVLIGAAIAAVVLVVEDFLTFLDGGDSVIGRFIDKLWGPGSAAEAAANLRLALEGLHLWLKDYVIPGWKDLGKAVKLAMDDAAEWVKGFADSVTQFFKPAVDAIKEFFSWVNSVGGKVLGFLKIDGEGLKNDFKAFNDMVKKTKDAQDKYNKQQSKTSRPWEWEGGLDAGIKKERQENLKAIRMKIMEMAGPKASPESMRAASGKFFKQNPAYQSYAPQVNNTINVEVKGDASRQTAREIGAATQQGASRGAKSALKALKQGAEG